VTDNTQLEVQASSTPHEGQRHVTFADVGGLEAEVRQLRELIEAPFRHARVYQSLGVDLVQGILLAGPPGTGKTLLTRALANELGVHTEVILGAEVYSGIYGQTEALLRKSFENAIAHQPSLIIIDEIDALAPRRDAVSGEQERRVVATLATLFDRLRGRQVSVLATTNRPDALDPALRRPGRLEREINLVAPGKQQRCQILQIYLERYRRAGRLGQVNLDEIAEETFGYVGADLAAVVRQAGLIAIRRHLGGAVETVTPATVADVVITQEDLLAAVEAQPPSALRELRVELPEHITWDDIGGLEEVKQELQETLVHGLRHPEVFRQLGQRPLRGVLFYGPPGTGKTLLAKAVANAGQANFISVRGPELRSRWFGESEAKVREVFAKARQTRPCVVFFDELDALAPARGRSVTEAADSIVNQLLAEMDGLATVDGVMVLGATNRPELLDPALLRPGRFDHHLHIPLPDREARSAILGVHKPNMPFDDEAEEYLQVLADYTEGYSGADLAELMRKASTLALRRSGWDPTSCHMERSDLEEALTQMRRQKARIEGLGLDAREERRS
ncbi:MAG: AAA family ATPase, partial [Armatimonadetes bacterium]|nr:AAA family ATPase [Armatimonadota bacterium]